MTSPRVDDALARLLRDGRRRAVEGQDVELWSAVEEAADGGKRLRPTLLLWAHEVLGGGDVAVATRVAAAIELLHTAFVIHDDVIDGDRTRRGRPNVSGSFAGRLLADGADGVAAGRYGDAAGILAGDLALAAAVRAVALCGAPADTVRRLLDLLDGALHTSAAGELTDVRLSLGAQPVALGEVLAMEARKTAAYSFELPLQAGALLADADEATATRLGDLGRLLGVAFQLYDDLDGVFGDESVTGKSTLSDLREGKCTPLIAYARTTAAWPRIAPYVGDAGIDDGVADEVRTLLVGCGARAFVEELAAEHAQAALRLADDLGLGPGLHHWVTAWTGRARRAA